MPTSCATRRGRCSPPGNSARPGARRRGPYGRVAGPGIRTRIKPSLWERGDPRLLVPWRDGAALEQAALDGETEQLGAGLQAELVTQAPAVGLNGLHAYSQLVGGFLVGVPLRQEPEHLGLTRAQWSGPPGSRRIAGDGPKLVATRRFPGTGEIHEGAAVVDGAYRGQQLDI